MYSLNYAMIAQVLRQFHYSGEAHANIPSCADFRGGGHTILIVQAGLVVSCSIFNKNARKLYHDREAHQRIERLGILDWNLVPFFSSMPTVHLTTEPPVPARPPAEPLVKIRPPIETPLPPVAETPLHLHLPGETPPPPSAEMLESYFPRHRAVSPTQLRTWPMLYRSVYSLCDGTHSNQSIATLLSRPPQSVEKVLRDLIAADAIEK